MSRREHVPQGWLLDHESRPRTKRHRFLHSKWLVPVLVVGMALVIFLLFWFWIFGKDWSDVIGG